MKVGQRYTWKESGRELSGVFTGRYSEVTGDPVLIPFKEWNYYVVPEENLKEQYGKVMDGKAEGSAAVAYCDNPTHKGELTQRLIREHNCISKECPYLQKYERNIFWCQKSVANVVRKAKKSGKFIQINNRVFATYDIDKLTRIYIKEWGQNGDKPDIRIEER